MIADTAQAVESIVGARHVRAAGRADAVEGVLPRWVVEPESTEEAAAILALANRKGWAVAPRGGGTKMAWGNSPKRLDAVLSTLRMNRVLEHAAGDLVVRVQAGASLSRVQAELGRAGQWLALDPPQPGATIGGVIATNASGPRRARYGTVRDLLIGLTYVTGDGKVAKSGGRVVKNVAGYDLCKLFAGSLGTLGLITEAILRLHPLPAAARTVIVSMPESDCDDALQALLRSSLVPGAVELAGLSPSRLLVRFEGVEPGVVAQAGEAERILAAFGDVQLCVDEDEWKWLNQRRLPLADSTNLKIGVPIAELGSVLRDLASLQRQDDPALSMGGSLSGHAANGILHVTIGGPIARQMETIRRLREGIEARGGSLVIHEAPPDVKRSLDVWGSVGDALHLMRAVKARFDPGGVMNPGRFAGGI